MLKYVREINMINKKLKNKIQKREKKKLIKSGRFASENTKPSYVVSKQFKVNKSEELLAFLMNNGITHSTAKSLLTKHQVLVNGNVVSQYNLLLVKDDEIKITKRSVKDAFILPKQTSPVKKKIKLPFDIIYQDEDIIAINKPAGLLSVESDNQNESAYAYMLQYFQNKDKKLRPFILHRIDKETSGVLIFAKNPVIHSMLKLHWNDLVKTREYIALVEGEMEQNQGTYVSYLKLNKNNLMFSSPDKTGQRAVTNYVVIKKNKDYSLLKVNIDTGRKNQIRVHMHDIHHSIVGDDKYGYSKNPLNRLGLHASKLEFVNPKTKQLISISAPTPTLFEKVFK